MSKDTITPAGLAALTRSAGGKYHSRRTWVEEIGRWFDSQKEADVAVGLWRRQQAGEIRGLRFQIRYPIQINGVQVCVYVADFVYDERSVTVPVGTVSGDGALPPPVAYWRGPIVADAKGYRTPVYRLKRALMRACRGIDVLEL